MTTRALASRRRAALLLLLAVSASGGLLPSPLFAASADGPEVVPMKLLRVTFRDMERKNASQPVIKMPSFSLGGNGAMHLPALSGYTVQGPGSVSVVAPVDATSVEGAMGTRDITLSGPCSVTINATWTPSESAEFLAACLLNRGTNQIGFQGVIDGEEGVPVPLSATKSFTTTVAFRTGDSGEAFYFSAEFETGSEGSYVRGWVDFVYTLELEPVRVDTLEDVVDGDFSEGKQSLREALQRAGNKETAIDIPILVSGTIELDDGPLVTSGANANMISLIPFDGSVTLDGGGANRILVVGPVHQITAYALTFTGGRAQAGTAGGAPEVPAEGGAILNMGVLELHHCLLNLNFASDGGGAICTRLNGELPLPPTTLLRDCLFDKNGSDLDLGSGGSALLVKAGASLAAVNTVVINSHAAISNMGALDLRHCTLFLGMDLVTGAAHSTTKIGHCIIDAGFRFGNPNSPDIRLLEHAEVESLGYNTIANHPPGGFLLETDHINVDSGVRLTQGGGGIFLSAFSPCVDSGDPDFFGGEFTPSLSTDILGNPRKSAGGTIDRGAMEVSALALLLADILRNSAPNADLNLNGTPDLVDALTGLGPDERHESPPLKIGPGSSEVASALHDGKGENSAPPPAFTLIETRVDERIVDGEVTLQTSPDLITWTDRVTYIPNGPESGYTRVLPVDFPENDITFHGDQKNGFCHLIREQLPLPSSGRLFTRLKGTQYAVE